MISASELCEANGITVEGVGSAILVEGTRVDFLDSFEGDDSTFPIYAGRVLLSIRRAGYPIAPDEETPVDPELLRVILGRVFSRMVSSLTRDGVRQWSQTIGDTSIQQTYSSSKTEDFGLDDEDWALLAEFYGSGARTKKSRLGSVNLLKEPVEGSRTGDFWVDWDGEEWRVPLP